ncbi:MAG: hypothetical protein L6Q71_06660 [Planctomycetes bacterium]|nr:hypothetical protein [Planctomycetota bacterium]
MSDQNRSLIEERERPYGIQDIALSQSPKRPKRTIVLCLILGIMGICGLYGLVQKLITNVDTPSELLPVFDVWGITFEFIPFAIVAFVETVLYISAALLLFKGKALGVKLALILLIHGMINTGFRLQAIATDYYGKSSIGKVIGLGIAVILIFLCYAFFIWCLVGTRKWIRSRQS